MIAILLADGFEEIEALTPLDILRRAGLDAKTVGVTSKIAVGSHGIPVVCDLIADEVNTDEVSAVIFPGGMPGSLNLDASPFSDKIIEAVNKKGGIIAAICAAPLVLGRRGLLTGKKATCYPGFENELKGATVKQANVVTDGNITTANGMEAALPFAQELVRVILNKNEEKVQNLGLLCDERFIDGVEIAIKNGKVSTSLLQRKISIGYGMAAKFIDTMEDLGIVSEPNGQKPRDVLITLDEWHEMLERLTKKN